MPAVNRDIIARWRRWKPDIQKYGSELLCLRRDGTIFEIDLATHKQVKWKKEYRGLTIEKIEEWIATQEDFHNFRRVVAV